MKQNDTASTSELMSLNKWTKLHHTQIIWTVQCDV